MKAIAAIAFLASAFATVAPSAADKLPVTTSKDAVIHYVSPFQTPVGYIYGMSAVDSLPLVLDQRSSTRVASGLRTVWYSCPNELAMAGGSRLSFDFKAGGTYELVCHAGQRAEIRTAEEC